MATCSTCGTTILLGGKSSGVLRFCSDRCLARGRHLAFAAQVPDTAVEEHARRILAAPCPLCHGSGPVDVHNAYTIWSALYVTSWKTTGHISCRACGRKAQVRALAFSAVFGWWGFPWGFVMTPVQIARNIGGLRRGSSATEPSRELCREARLALAAQLANQAPEPAPSASVAALDLQSVITGLHSPDPNVRHHSATALGDRGALAIGALPELAALQRDPDRAVRMRAKWALETIGEKTRS